MNKKKQLKTLTKSEKYQFSLTASTAKTVSAQRAAIDRCGLGDATPASVRKARQEAFAAFCSKQKDSKRLPKWVLGARYAASGDDWMHDYTGSAGRTLDNQFLAQLAHDAVDWGRLRKHSRGDATAFAPRQRTETNGKSGWDCVTWRYADYMCVLSPDRKRVAIQVDSKPVEVHAVFRGRCLFRDSVLTLWTAAPLKATRHERTQAALLRHHGFEARVVRQTREMVSAGSGETLRNGASRECIVPDGLGGWYHVGNDQSVSQVRAALNKRRVDRRSAELDAKLASEGHSIWVTISDSVSAGNCERGTSAFVPQIQSAIGATGEIGAITAAALLAIRKDEFTLRACRVAALRQSV